MMLLHSAFLTLTALTGLFHGLDNSACTGDTACARYDFNIKWFGTAPVLCFHTILALESLQEQQLHNSEN